MDSIRHAKTTLVAILAFGLAAQAQSSLTIYNRKDSDAVEIRIVEFTKTDSQTIEFRVPVPAGGEKVVTYKVHYTW